MIQFKDIELQDKELITSYTLNSPRQNCDLSFSNLCSWRFLYNTKFAILDGFLLLKFWANEEPVYMMPIGNGNLNKDVYKRQIWNNKNGAYRKIIRYAPFFYRKISLENFRCV